MPNKKIIIICNLEEELPVRIALITWRDISIDTKRKSLSLSDVMSENEILIALAKSLRASLRLVK
jgi:hypothetical protein